MAVPGDCDAKNLCPANSLTRSAANPGDPVADTGPVMGCTRRFAASTKTLAALPRNFAARTHGLAAFKASRVTRTAVYASNTPEYASRDPVFAAFIRVHAACTRVHAALPLVQGDCALGIAACTPGIAAGGGVLAACQGDFAAGEAASVPPRRRPCRRAQRARTMAAARVTTRVEERRSSPGTLRRVMPGISEKAAVDVIHAAREKVRAPR